MTGDAQSRKGWQEKNVVFKVVS